MRSKALQATENYANLLLELMFTALNLLDDSDFFSVKITSFDLTSSNSVVNNSIDTSDAACQPRSSEISYTETLR